LTTVTSDAPRTGEIQARRLYWAGPVTVVSAVVGVWLVQQILLAILPSSLPRFSGSVLHSNEPALVTAVLVTAAVLTFAIVVDLATVPLRFFRRLSVGVLVLSCVPNLLGLLSGRVDIGMLALMSLHVVAWAITVTMLTKLSVARATGRLAAEQ
jgi:hypothetical protein